VLEVLLINNFLNGGLVSLIAGMLLLQHSGERLGGAVGGGRCFGSHDEPGGIDRETSKRATG
jgi:hypothetical protein